MSAWRRQSGVFRLHDRGPGEWMPRGLGNKPRFPHQGAPQQVPLPPLPDPGGYYPYPESPIGDDLCPPADESLCNAFCKATPSCQIYDLDCCSVPGTCLNNRHESGNCGRHTTDCGPCESVVEPDGPGPIA